MTPFINEFHYDNSGSDIGEFIEIASPTGFDLSGWSIVLYNGSNGTPYNTIDLSGLPVADGGAGFGFVTVQLPANGLQNGSPDGMALVDDNGTVIEFLSYEGVVQAFSGPAAGMTSTDVGVAETGATAIGQSLQRQGTGDGSAAVAGDFVFAGPLAATPGAVNEGQSFGDLTPVLPSLVINEVNADPASGLTGDANGDGIRDFSDDEFVELVNTGDFDADLSGITISDGVQVRHVFEDGTMLAAGAAIVVFGGGTPTGEFGGAQVVTASTGSLGLNNSGDVVTLATDGGDVISFLEYGSEAGQNQSLTRDPDTTGDFVEHSGAASSEGALFSPGTKVNGDAFVIPTLTPVLAINEIHADPAIDLPGDANGDGIRDFSDDEFVELVNTGDFDADLSGVTISDGVQVRHVFVDGTILAAGAAIVVFGGGTPTGEFGGAQVVTASTGALGLNNGGDTVTVATAEGDVITQVVYDSEAGNNQSLTRDPDETGAFLQHSDATGADGALFSPGEKIDGTPFVAPDPVFTINEIDSDQSGTDSAEFVELYDGGLGNSSLDGMFLALFNGGSDTSYNTIDLTGYSTDENGFFVIGSLDVPNVDLVVFTTNGLQNGADAVALYAGAPSDLANGAPTTENLIDAIVYDTNDADDTGLLGALGQTVQFNEDENGLKDSESLSRVPDGSGEFIAQTPTPGESNEVIAPPELVLISEVQGSTAFNGFADFATVGIDDRSVLEGQTIRIQAVVTADFQSASPGVVGTDLNGFFVQEEDADADADVTTSEGVFIFDDFAEGNPDVQVGDLVEITGTVSEFFGETQISASFVEVLASNQTLPTATVVTLDNGVMIDQDGDFVANLEAFEGMRVTFDDVLTVTELFQLGRFGTFKASADGKLEQFTQNNAPDTAGYAQHLQDIAARTITIDDGTNAQNPGTIRIPDGNDGVLTADDSFRMGDTLTNVTGVLSYSENFQSSSEEPEFRIHLPDADYEATNPRQATPEDVGGTFKVASLNVLNYFTTLDDGSNNAGPNNDQGARGADDLTRFGVEPAEAEFERQADKIVRAIIEIDADVLGLVELENDNDEAIADLVARVNDALGSEIYGFVATGDLGNDAITNGMIYKLDKVNLVGDFVALESFEGRSFLDPLSAGRDLNRPALAQTFEDVESGELITVAVNHLKSKGSLSGLEADNDQLDGQGNNNATRTEAVKILTDWLATDPTGQGAENQIVLGDLNSYAQEDPIIAMEAAGFTNTLSGSDTSYVFDGQTGSLDYIFINDALADNLSGATVWDINSPEATVIDYNLDFSRDPNLYNGDNAARNSDHDPLIAGFTFEELPPPINVVQGQDLPFEQLDGTSGADEIRTGGGQFDNVFGLGGADEFVIEQQDNGIAEMVNIFDYEVGVDSIDLQGREVLYDYAFFGSTYLVLANDFDTVVVTGANDISEITFDTFLFT